MFYIDNDTRTQDKFDMAKFINFIGEGVFDPLDSYLLLMIPKLPVVGYYVVRKEVNRPDLLAYNIYRDTQYWWVLMWYNAFYKPQDLKAGVTIKYPSLTDIQQLYLNASLLEKTE